eukprot:CAMPEP_0181061916 /NCGR_PEP_ID=MMETSP1070-20121207/22790_1 /TAXON_ID=265543 /ORGANISM="Minutocellus polymorphus, Strain NH13" /LENGTH=80 /DNA_ID=CAMNT_0023141931 /DNA_START=1229 /DNA_END=1471 /DNA_ORIENTATION=-
MTIMLERRAASTTFCSAALKRPLARYAPGRRTYKPVTVSPSACRPLKRLIMPAEAVTLMAPTNVAKAPFPDAVLTAQYIT